MRWDAINNLLLLYYFHWTRVHVIHVGWLLSFQGCSWQGGGEPVQNQPQQQADLLHWCQWTRNSQTTVGTFHVEGLMFTGQPCLLGCLRNLGSKTFCFSADWAFGFVVVYFLDLLWLSLHWVCVKCLVGNNLHWIITSGRNWDGGPITALFSRQDFKKN